MNCTLQHDDTFGPTISACPDRFEFTLLFEQSILQLAPSAVFLLVFPLRALHLHKQHNRVLRTGTPFSKQFTILCLACTQLALLVLWSVSPAYQTQFTIPVAAISFAASAALFYISTVEHSRSIRPSTLINGYILFSLILDIPQTRTLWLKPGPRSLPALFTVVVGLKAVGLVLEARSKRFCLHQQYQRYGPEALVSLYDRTLLLWLNAILWHGYRSFVILEEFYSLDEGLQSKYVGTAFADAWTRYARFKKHTTLWATYRSVRTTFFSMLLPRLCLSALRLLQPLLINRITSLLSEDQTDLTLNYGKGLIGATALVYVGIAIATASFQRHLHRLMTQTRGCLLSAIYRKTLTLQSSQLADSSALTIVSTDVNRISACLKEIHILVATPIEVAVAVYLLQVQVGVACVAPVALAVIISLMSLWNAGRAVALQKDWLTAVSKRVAYISVILENPKGFKMLDLAGFFTTTIQSLRVEELAKYARFRKHRAIRNGVGTAPQAYGPAITLLMFTLMNGSESLTPSTAFTSLALVALLTSPIEELIHAIPSFESALASFERVQCFLSLEENIPERCDPVNSAIQGQTSPVESPLELTRRSGVASLALHSITMDHVSVTLNANQILKDLDLQLLRGNLIFVTGRVGSGKSTLLKTIIGDLKPTAGTIHTETHEFSYCAQDVWLPNASIRDLVIGASEYDAEWYRTVVMACALFSDLAVFPAGDETIVGTRGISLSGGQRQRLSLARAIYARNKIIVADGVLSGLDNITSRHVFQHVFGKTGLCKRIGTTVLLATAGAQYLEEADSVIMLDGQGGAKHLDAQELASLGNLVQNDVSGNGAHVETTLAGTNDESEPNSTRMQDLQHNVSRKNGSIAVYGYYAKSVGWTFASILLITVASFAFGMKFQVLWVKWWSESQVPGQGYKSLHVWLTVMFVLAAVAVISICVHVWVMLVHTVTQSSARLHNQILNVCMRASYAFFVSTDTGMILNRFSNDMSLIEEELATAVMQVFNGAAFSIASVLLVMSGADYASAALPVLFFALYCIQRFYLRTSRQLRLLELEAQAPLLSHFSETISGASTIKAFGWQDHSHLRNIDLLDGAQRPYYLLLCVQRWLALVLQLVTGATAVVIVGLAVSLRSTSSSGAVGASMLEILGFSWILNHFVNAWTTLETSLGAVARCRNFERDTPQEDKVGEDLAQPPDWPAAGEVIFSDLSASYTEGGDTVLKNITLSIKAGEKIGICGRSGSGKSSLILALLRLLDDQTGSITIDGTDIALVRRHIIRERIVALPQEAVVFPGSIRTNLDPYEQTTDEQIRTALLKVGLMEYIDRRGGLTADLALLNLSHGQLRLLAVARALLSESKVLVVDEISSSVDLETEELMMRLIRQEFSNRTIIAIAHQLHTLAEFDRVVVMENGRIVEVGQPSQLLADENGAFRRMWDAGKRL